MRKLYPYQENIVKYLKDNAQAAAFVEMRLGKTLCTIRALKDIPGRKLIVCPKSVIPTWCEELEKEGIQDYLWFSSEFLKRHQWKGGMVYDIPEWCIVNYEASMRLDDLWKKLFNHIIIDESVAIKNPKAKLTRFFLQNGFHNAERKILLSGNPAPNTPLEYFTQMQFLYGSWMNCDNYWQFRRRYFVSDLQGWQWWTRHSSKDVIRIELQKKCFFLSRKEVGVENKKVYSRRVVEMPVALRKEYKRMEKEFVATLPTGEKLETKYILPRLLYLQEMASGHLVGHEMSDHKIKELVSLLEGELKGEQVLVWCRFTWEIEALQKALSVKGITHLAIHGKVSLTDRKKFQKEFNEKIVNVLVLQVQTSRFGLNLSSADQAIYFSNSFSSDDRSQSEMRIELNGKTTPLLYLDIVCKDSIDEDILKALEKKQKDAAYFMEIIDGIKNRQKQN